jgi:cytochrome c556
MARTRDTLLAGAIAALFVAAAAPAAAGEGAAAIVERQALMKLIGANFGSTKQAVDSKDAARLKQAEGNARAIAAAAAAIPTMFPKGSDAKAGKTAALPAVWDKAADFQKAAQTMGGEAAALADALKAGDPQKAAAQWGQLAKAGCGGCHDTFRAKQN